MSTRHLLPAAVLSAAMEFFSPQLGDIKPQTRTWRQI